MTSCDLRKQAVVGSMLLKNNSFEVICLDLSSNSCVDVLNTSNFPSSSSAESHQSFPVLGCDPWNYTDVWVSSGRAAISSYGLYLTTLLSHPQKKKKNMLPTKSVHKGLLKEVSQAPSKMGYGFWTACEWMTEGSSFLLHWKNCVSSTFQNGCRICSKPLQWAMCALGRAICSSSCSALFVLTVPSHQPCACLS